MIRCSLVFVTLVLLVLVTDAFVVTTKPLFRVVGQWNSQQDHLRPLASTSSNQQTSTSAVKTIEEATAILAEWDQNANPDAVSKQSSDFDNNNVLPKIAGAVRLLNEAARKERNQDSTRGRVMLGICAGSTEEGLATLKSWVGALELPRGLLHGMDKDGVPLQLDGAVYLKYNTGGSLTFADIRKSGQGFDAIWKPGDVLLEMYDGTYRGVYFQVELADGVFRQFLVPLDIFEGIS